jgi:hypothetical protein
MFVYYTGRVRHGLNNTVNLKNAPPELEVLLSFLTLAGFCFSISNLQAGHSGRAV